MISDPKMSSVMTTTSAAMSSSARSSSFRSGDNNGQQRQLPKTPYVQRVGRRPGRGLPPNPRTRSVDIYSRGLVVISDVNNGKNSSVLVIPGRIGNRSRSATSSPKVVTSRHEGVGGRQSRRAQETGPGRYVKRGHRTSTQKQDL